jgi:hypothetical protein
MDISGWIYVENDYVKDYGYRCKEKKELFSESEEVKIQKRKKDKQNHDPHPTQSRLISRE